MSVPINPKSGVKVKTLGKALNVLDCFLDQPILGVVELAEKLGLNKSNVSDLLSTFEAMGFLVKDGKTGKYQLGLKMLRYAHAISTNMGFHQYVFPVMQETADALNEMVYFGVPEGSEVLYLDGAFPAQSVRNVLVRSMAGDHAPLYCTGIGKAMLSRMPRAQWDSSIPEEPFRFTNYTLTDREAIIADLEETLRRGYSIDNMEHEFGVKCVGIAILNRYGQMVAGMSVSGPSLRFDEERIETIAGHLLDRAAQLSQIL